MRPATATLPNPQDWRAARLTPGTPAEIEKSRTRILDALGPEATDIDDMVRWCAEPVATVLAGILELELAGQISRNHGNRICRIIDTDKAD